MKISLNVISSGFIVAFFISSPVLGEVTIPRNFSGTSDSTYANEPTKAVEWAAVAAKNAAWEEGYGNCTLSNYNYWQTSLHYSASANVACTKPGESGPIVVVFTFTGTTDEVLDLFLTEEGAIDAAVSRAESAAASQGYSECTLKNYNSWQPNPPSQKWMANAAIDCKNSVNSIPVGA